MCLEEGVGSARKNPISVDGEDISEK